ncbi:MAG: DUF6145 family protein [Lachnospiraceae bacterium]|nr:DUF6145 family protein [Lachnospiraceae bacterium]
MSEKRSVLCGANAYEQKYYFNKEEYGNLPTAIQEELHVMCVLFTEEVGGIFTVVFEEDGGVSLDTMAAENDFYYDEVSAALLVGQIRQKRRELLESLSLYYRTFVLHEGLDEKTGEDA